MHYDRSSPAMIEGSRLCPICELPGHAIGVTVKFREMPASTIFACRACAHRWSSLGSVESTTLAKEVVIRNASTSSQWILERLPTELNNRDQLRVLDIGCWDGSILAGLPRSWDKTGIELNRSASELARGRGINVVSEPIESANLPSGSYDMVMMMDILEHLGDPLGVLTKVRELLAPEGYLVCLTGDAGSWGAVIYRGKWYYHNYPEHITFFTKRSIQAGFAKTGFNVVSIETVVHQTASMKGTITKILQRLSGAQQAKDDSLGQPVNLRDALPLLISRILRKRDHLFVVAKKSSTS